MSTFEQNNPPIRIIVKDVRILSDKNLSKTVDILVDEKRVDVELQAKKAPDKAWRLKDRTVLSESLTIRPYLHRSFYRTGDKTQLADIAFKANDLEEVIVARNGPTDYEITRDGLTVIVGVEHDALDIETGQADISNAPVVAVTLKGIKLFGIGKAAKFYVQLLLNDETRKTQVTKGQGVVAWQDTFDFDIPTSYVLELQAFEVHHMREDVFLGRVRQPLSELLRQDDGHTDLTMELFKSDKAVAMQDMSIGLFIEWLDGVQKSADLRQAGTAVQDAEAMESHKHPLPSMLASVAECSRFAESTLEVVGPVMEKMDCIAEIHPYVNLAWKTLSFVLQIYLSEINRNQKIQDLLRALNRNYAFVENKTQDYVANHQVIITQILKQTTECTYFMRSYFHSSGIVSHTWKELTSGIQKKIEDYQKSFADLYNQLQQDAIANIEIGMTSNFAELLTMNREQAFNRKLSNLAYASGASLDLFDICLPGTRTGILDEIAEWVSQTNKDDATSVYLLIGAAGSGKSTIARTIAKQFDSLKRLGSSFAFNRADQQNRHASNCLTTITRDVARLVFSWKVALLEIITKDDSLCYTRSIRAQWNSLIVKPAQTIAANGPILIIIDALDECENNKDYETLLNILAKLTHDLPPNIQLLITACPEPLIMRAFNTKSHVHIQDMNDISLQSTQSDILSFVENKFNDIYLENHIDYDYCYQITKKADGLFQWASTACHYIIDNFKSGMPPIQKVELVLAGHISTLDDLYYEILANSLDIGNNVSATQYQTILDQVFSLKEPVTFETLLRLYDDRKGSMWAILAPLACLFGGVAFRKGIVQPIHISFRDFLLDEKKSKNYSITLTYQNEMLSKRSLQIMNDQLKFNICNLKSSYLPNAKIKNLELQIKVSISSELFYASKYWADHTLAVNLSTLFADLLYNFVQKYILFWFEHHSLQYEHMNYVEKALHTMVAYLQTKNEELWKLFHDAYQFIKCFALPICQSAPHIYVSALQFLPMQSELEKMYLSKQPYVVTSRVQGQRQISWPITQFTMMSPAEVLYITFSPDGSQIVSGSTDKTIRIWNAKTGEMIGQPLQGHNDWVRSITFSPNGSQIVSGSDDKTIRIWNIKTGENNGQPLQGHTHSVNSVAFSPDGSQIVSGSDDNTIRIWNARTGENHGQPLQGHTHSVKSVAFSSDGSQIVSGSNDQTIKIWNAKTRENIGQPLQDHTSGVTSVAFSPDGSQIVSSSCDSTIRIWNARTGENIGQLLQGHTDWVNSIAFSPDGSQIVSSSNDNTIRIWNAKTGENIDQPLQGHTGSVTSVEFSPDGNQIVSSSSDNTIRIWNAKTGENIGQPLQGYISSVQSFAFSPDGSQIVSGSRDEAIKIWNAKTGKNIGKPLQGHTGQVRSVAFSPDGSQIVSGSDDNTVRIWNAKTGENIGQPLQGHTSSVTYVAFSPDGSQIVSSSDDQIIRIWNAKTGEKIGQPLQGHTDWVNSIAFSPDGSQIVSGSDDETIIIWNVKTGKNIGQPLQGHTGRVRSVAFSPDGSQIVSGSDDRTIRIWNVRTGENICQPPQSYTDQMNPTVLSPDGTQIISSSHHGTMRTWDEQDRLNSQKLVNHGASLYARPKTSIYNEEISSEGKSTFGPQDFHIMASSSNLTGNTAAAITDQSIISDDGWIRGPNDELLFWIPHWYRSGLYRPSNTMIISSSPSIKLDPTFPIGTDWTKSFHF